MKPSEWKQTKGPAEPVEPLPYPRSDIADPPIAEAEARAAQDSICRHHKGLICQTGDVEGTVFFCPIGREYWRYTKQTSGMFKPLIYPRGGFT